MEELIKRLQNAANAAKESGEYYRADLLREAADALSRPTPAAPVATEAVAQGVVAAAPCGGVDVEILDDLLNWVEANCEWGCLPMPVARAMALRRVLLSASPAGVGGWQEVTGDAPLPGLPVLAWGGDDVVYIATRANEHTWSAPDCEHSFTGVTHWQPLPAAPAIANQEARDGR